MRHKVVGILYISGAIALSVAAFGQNANFESSRSGVGFDSEALLGAKVQGPGTNAFGHVTNFVRDKRTGEVAMYVVETYGWFSGEGVIPVSNLIDIRSRQGKDEIEYRLEVSVNQATFRNLAKWDGEGRISSYLEDYSSILSTVYGIEPQALAASATYYQQDAQRPKRDRNSGASANKPQ